MSNRVATFVDIISEYTGKGAKDAEHSFGVLGNSALSMGKKLTAAFSVAAIGAFAGKAISLAAAEEKQFAILGNTLKNLGLGFATESSVKLIDSMYLATGVAKEQLIPAYQNLLTATSDVALSQKDLQLAMDVSAGTGKDLQAVTAALAKGYLGNTTSLTRLGAGLDKVLLKTGNMKLITEQLSRTFSGSAKTAAETFSGEMARLKAGAEAATVSIGTGLLTSINMFSGKNGIDGLVNSMDSLGKKTEYAITGIALLFQEVTSKQSSGWLSKLLNNTNDFIQFLETPLRAALRNTAGKVINKGSNYYNFKDASVDPAAIGYASAAQAKALKAKADQLAAEKKILATQKQQTAEQKAQATLKLAGNSDDLQKAELLAALKRDITQADKDQVNYQLDLLNAVGKTGDALQKAADDALILREKILMANGLVMLADGSIANLHEAKNPFAGFDKYVQDALAQLQKVQDKIDMTKAIAAGGNPNGIYNYPNGSAFTFGQNSVPDLTSSVASTAAPYSWMAGSPAYNPMNGNSQIEVNLNVTTDGSQIVTYTNAASANGTAVTLNRLNPQFG
jgi:hypothetical protein